MISNKNIYLYLLLGSLLILLILIFTYKKSKNISEKFKERSHIIAGNLKRMLELKK